MSASFVDVINACVGLYTGHGDSLARRRARAIARMFEPMKVTLKNHGAGRVRNDVLADHASNMRNANLGDGGQFLVMRCPRCFFNPAAGGTFIDLGTAPVHYDALADEDVAYLHRREIYQCPRCQLVMAESYFAPRPHKRFAVLHLIQPEE